MNRILYAGAAAAALTFAGVAHAAPPEGAGPPTGVPKGAPAGVTQGPPAGVTQGPPAGVGANMGVGADVSAAAKAGEGASAVLPHTRASETGVEHGSQAEADLDLDLDDDAEANVNASMGVGADVSAAAKSGGGAAAVLPHTRASETGVMHGSMSAADVGTDASVTLRGKARGRLDTDGDGIPDHRDPDANGNGVLDIHE